MDTNDFNASTGQRFVDIHSLPNELLTSIFHEGALMRTRHQNLPFPQLVSSINRHWREVAINFPELWCHGILFTYRCPTKVTSTWIQRSKSCMLDVTFDVCSKWFAEIKGWEILSIMIMPHIGRWRRLVIKVADNVTMQALNIFLNIPAARRLRELEVHILDSTALYLRHNDSPWLHRGLLTGGTPCLNSLKIHNACYLCLPSYRDLTSLDVRDSRLAHGDMLTLIKFSPGLQDLVIRDLLTTRVYPQEKILVASSLRSLAISYNCSRHMFCWCFCSMFTTPNLEYLELSYPGITWSALFRHLPAPRDPLQKLRIFRVQHLCISREDTHDPLPPRKIRIPTTHTEDQVSLQSDPDGESGLFQNDCIEWDRLSVLTLRPCTSEDLSLVERIVRQRIEAGNPLIKIRLPSEISETADGKQALARLQDQIVIDKLEDGLCVFDEVDSDDDDDDVAWDEPPSPQS